MYYGWEPIRDVARPGSLVRSEYINAYSFEHTDAMLTDRAIDYIEKSDVDFVFLYMVETDEKGGHNSGWMSDTYLQYVSDAFDNVRRIIEKFGNKYTVIVTAVHGGHDRSHGTDMSEDMTIPMFFAGEDFIPGKELQNVNLIDIAPTIADLMGALHAPEWEGKSLIEEK